LPTTARAVRCPAIQKLDIQVRKPVEQRHKVDELAQTISEMASVSHVRQKENLLADVETRLTP
jgi:hypothetical protein